MTNNKYIIKDLAPWMLDEIIVFSKNTKFDIILLRKQKDFYVEDLAQLAKNGVRIYTEPYTYRNFFRKIGIIIPFIFGNLSKFGLNYNGVIGIKSILWFLRLDLSIFSQESKIHAQFATQPAIISLLIKKYYNNKLEYSFTFHAHDIYFNNKWFKLLVKNSYIVFSISKFNIEYIKNIYSVSENIVLSRLGVFRHEIKKKEKTIRKDSNVFTLGLMTWFDEKKGINYLLDAMLELKIRGFNNIKLMLAGDGSLREEYLEFININELTDTISYIGKIKREEKQNFFNSIDTFILPSISLKKDQDGIPVVLMEAIAYSLPVISTNVSGIPEICINDYNGHLVNEKKVSELVNSIIYFYDNITKRNQYAKNSLLLSNEYDIALNSYSKLKFLGWL